MEYKYLFLDAFINYPDVFPCRYIATIEHGRNPNPAPINPLCSLRRAHFYFHSLLLQDFV